MNHSDQITVWLKNLRDDSSDAARRLWEKYFEKMVRIARRKLPDARRGMADEEDVALSAFKSFCVGIRKGRFAHLINRESLWALLLAITLNKARDVIRHELRQKRGGDAKAEPLWDNILCSEPSPEFTAQLAEQLQRLLASLDVAGDDDLHAIVTLSMEGYTTSEVAERLQCTMRTVQRKLKIVRKLWVESDE